MTRTGGRPALPGNNNYKVFEAGAQGARLQGGRHRADGDQRRRLRRPDACQQTGFCFQGCKWGAKWSAAYTDIPRGEATGNLEVRDRCQALKIEHDDRRAGDRGRLRRQGRQPAAPDGEDRRVAGNTIESPRLLLNSASSMFPDGLANSSGQVGRNYMRHTTGSVYAVFDGAGADVARHDDGRDHPGRGEARSEPRLRRRLRAGDAVARAAVHGGVPRPRRLGAGVHLGARRLRRTWPACGSSARTCRRRPTG